MARMTRWLAFYTHSQVAKDSSFPREPLYVSYTKICGHEAPKLRKDGIGFQLIFHFRSVMNFNRLSLF